MVKVLAHNLKYYRQELNLTQDECAKRAKISLRLFQQLEKGRTNPTLDTICKISSVFSVTPDELLRISFHRVPLSPNEYLQAFKETFEGLPLGAGIRGSDGTLFYMNDHCCKLTGFRPKNYPVNLFDFLNGISKDLLNSQLLSEAKGNLAPYINYFVSENSTTPRFIRLYPALILPTKGTKSYFTATHLCQPEEDRKGTYAEYCLQLLKIR